MIQRIANAGLRGKMDDDGKTMLLEQPFRSRTICQIEFHKTEIRMLFQNLKPGLFQSGIVIVIDDIETDDLAPARQQALRNMKSNEAGGSGDQHRLIRHPRFRS